MTVKSIRNVFWELAAKSPEFRTSVADGVAKMRYRDQMAYFRGYTKCRDGGELREWLLSANPRLAAN